MNWVKLESVKEHYERDGVKLESVKEYFGRNRVKIVCIKENSLRDGLDHYGKDRV